MILSQTAQGSRQNFFPAELTLQQIQDQIFLKPFVADVDYGFFWAQSDKTRKALEAKWKHRGGMVYFGTFENGDRHTNNVQQRTALTLDCDENLKNEDVDRVLKRLNELNLNFFLHTTFKSRPESPRFRIVLPLSQPLVNDGDSFESSLEEITLRAANLIEVGIDSCSYTSAQAMYKPVVLKGAEYFFRSDITGNSLNPEAMITGGNFATQSAEKALFSQLNDQKQEPGQQEPVSVSPSTVPSKGKKEKTYKDPRTFNGMRGMFNRGFPQIADAIARFLSDVYEPTKDPNRFSLKEANSTGGLTIFNGGMSCRSFHTNKDAAASAGKMLDSYTLVCTHKFSGDRKCMNSWIRKELSKELGLQETKYPHLPEGFPDYLLVEHEMGVSLLKAIRTYEYILENDDRFEDLIAFDGLAQGISLARDPYWRTVDPTYCILREQDVNEILAVIEVDYKMYNEQKLMKALHNVAMRKMYHPILDQIDAVEWDGVKRIPTLFQTFLGAEDLDGYTEMVAKKWFVGGYLRIKHPGTKFEMVPCLAGAQGVGKSKLAEALSLGFMTDELIDFTAKDTTELVISKWLCVDEEGYALDRGNIAAGKRFYAKTEDNVRLPYKARSEKYKRHVFFMVITNETSFLKDTTGNRRFFPIGCSKQRRKRGSWTLTQDEVLQIWAEARYYAEVEKEKPYLTDEEMQKIEHILDRYRDIQPEETDVIEMLVGGKVPPNWHQLNELGRLKAVRKFKTSGPGSDWVEIDYTCPAEIWNIFLGHKKIVGSSTYEDERVEKADSYPVATNRLTQYLLKAGFEQDSDKSRGNAIARSRFVGGNGPIHRENDRVFPGNIFWHRTDQTDELAKTIELDEKASVDDLLEKVIDYFEDGDFIDDEDLPF